ncbi:Amino acid transporter, transmembrane domain [Cinara cedri]|uniref:Amino acid transporter, transmembrane domain n=1 Tax=Cinara cedri TaxID=506608 RepID=A0A5E4M6N5_9HEMI|nr:Amino acid transporter, transmembrane domain [Cinara cedri]
MIMNPSGLTVPFAILCIVDLFGVYPIVVLPGPIIKCGWFGIPLAVMVFAVQMYTAILLGKCWIIAEEIDPSIDKKNRYPYAALAELIFGNKVKRIVTVMLDIAVFGACIPNLLIASYNFHVLGLKLSADSFDVSPCVWLIVVGIVLCPLLWLGSPKDMKWIALSSVFSVCFVSVLTWIAMMDTQREEYQTIGGPSWNSVALAYGILAFQFDVHPLVLTVQMDMVDKRKLPLVIVWAFSITCSLFLITTTIGYVRFGSVLSTNLLDELSDSRFLNVDITLVTIQICLSTVVSTTALFQHIEHFLRIPREFNWKRCVLRSSVVMVAVAIGEAVPRFDLLMGLVGALLTGPLMFLLPPLFYVKIRSLRRLKIKTSDRVCYRTFPDAAVVPIPVVGFKRLTLLAFIVLTGTLATVLSTVSSVRDTIIYAQFTPSCIMQLLYD